MKVELTKEEIWELLECIESAWLDGFDDNDLDTAYEKLKSSLEDVE